jgi:NAD+-dependent protein deacetylase SIR2
MNPSSSPPSSPLSSLGRSPSPPAGYPSPPSSNGSENGKSSQGRDAAEASGDRDGPPPAKRQKTMKSKDLKTEYLNLQALNESDDESHHQDKDPMLRRLVEALRSKRKIVVIAGAGISVSAGSKCPISP